MQMSTVFFDLETTGLDTSVCEIIQLAAVCEGVAFNVYILPNGPIPNKVRKMTGLRVRRGVLYRYKRNQRKRVGTFTLDEALRMFISFLKKFDRPLQLAAHNANRFDRPVLVRALQQVSLLHDFQQVEPEFLDTLLLSRKLFGAQLPSHSLKNLVWHFLNKSFNAHNALHDARVLEELYDMWNPSVSNVLSSTFPL